jgi:thiol-disulfide isomerase/thioredoxin
MSGRRARREQTAHAEQPRRPSRHRAFARAGAAAVLVAAVAAIAAVALTRGGASSGASSPRTAGGSNAQPLQLSGTDPIDGRQISLAAFPGKPIVLNIWASWCTGCYAEAQALATFERTHPRAQVVGVDVQDSVAGARAFYRRFGWRHPSIFDPQGVVATRFGLQGLPATLFLDRRHRVVAKILGETNLAGFEAGYRRALHE